MSEERGLLYLDSSALVKLVLPEAETEALFAALQDWPDRVTSELARVEVIRASRRASDDDAVHERATGVLAGLHLLHLDSEILHQASQLSPALLRSLDAIHLASAMSIRSDVEAFAVYDGALADAAHQRGFEVIAPG